MSYLDMRLKEKRLTNEDIELILNFYWDVSTRDMIDDHFERAEIFNWRHDI